MTRLLIFETALGRVAPALKSLPGKLDLLVVDREGQISLNGEALDVDTAQPDIVWASGEMYGGSASRNFMVAALKSNELKWVHSGAAGFDHPVFRQLVEKGARLTNSHGQAISIAEYVLAEVLGYLQRLPERRAEQAAHRWTRLPFRELKGSRWLAIGFGAIGQAVAERAGGFGAKITGVRRNQAPHPLAEKIAPQSEATKLAGDADVVVLSPPLTPETRGMVDAAFLAGMKPGSILVNVGRGGLVDEPALLAALEKGVPEHAILDVFAAEPLQADSPFWDHPRVSLTGHASAFGSGNAARNDEAFVENLRRYLAGESLISEVAREDVMAG